MQKNKKIYTIHTFKTVLFAAVRAGEYVSYEREGKRNAAVQNHRRRKTNRVGLWCHTDACNISAAVLD